MVSNLQPCYSLGTEQSPSVEFFHTPFHTVPHFPTHFSSLIINHLPKIHIFWHVLCNYNLRKRKAS